MLVVETLNKSSRSPPVPQTSRTGPGKRAGSRRRIHGIREQGIHEAGHFLGGFALGAKRLQEIDLRALLNAIRNKIRDGLSDVVARQVVSVEQLREAVHSGGFQYPQPQFRFTR